MWEIWIRILVCFDGKERKGEEKKAKERKGKESVCV